MIKENKIILAILIMATSLFASNGKEIFDKNCISCHIMKMGWQVTPKEKMNMNGPTAFGITKHVKDVFSNEKQFVEFVTEYITRPVRIKARCKDNVISKFGIMPAVSKEMSQADKKSVSSWMFNNIGVK
ncbi:MAG: c-type cytochrome [Campylobacterota bacterium]|nr:c-type cytochrome [Campylobacterota bacterium]